MSRPSPARRLARVPTLIAVLGCVGTACALDDSLRPPPPAPGERAETDVGQGAPPAPAETSALPASALPSSRLFPSSSERRLQLERALGRELEATLATATGVERARVHLALPPPEPLVGSAPQEPGKAFVLLQHAPGKAPWQEHEVRELVAGAVAGLTPERVRVVFQEVPPPTRTESSEPAWESVGPLRVERDSARQLRWLLGVFSASGLLLVGALGALWWRLRLSLRQPDREPSGPWAVRTRVPPAP